MTSTPVDPASSAAQSANTAAANDVSNGPQLAIGSLGTAQDGKYQAVISNLSKTSGGRAVERQMLDRLVDGGMVAPPWLSYVLTLAHSDQLDTVDVLVYLRRSHVFRLFIFATQLETAAETAPGWT